jgi:rsbT antagonist protein RsbS
MTDFTKLSGMHLTEIGRGVFLLEPSRSLDISARDELVVTVLAHLQQAQAGKLYYDLASLPLIDPLYYHWLNLLARACRAVNVTMACIRMQPAAAFALSSYMEGSPDFSVEQGVR